jgi:2-oxoglutarate ferredoxin oxidoreductase subunit alpha
MTPVFLLSDGYIANGSEPWRFPSADKLKPIVPPFQTEPEGEVYHPYLRDEKLVRRWVVPGTPGLEHRIGGIEKQDITGNISYDPENHQKMVGIRAEKVARIADHIPLQKFDQGEPGGQLCFLSWGSTYGAVKTATKELIEMGHAVAHIHLRYLNPLPKNLGELLKGFDQVVVPELNNGQLVQIIRSRYLIDARPLNKIKGLPFTSSEILEYALKTLDS